MSARLSVNINDDTAAAIREAQERRQTTATDVIRRAVSLYAFMHDAEADGGRFELVGPGKTRTFVRLLP